MFLDPRNSAPDIEHSARSGVEARGRSTRASRCANGDLFPGVHYGTRRTRGPWVREEPVTYATNAEGAPTETQSRAIAQPSNSDTNAKGDALHTPNQDDGDTSPRDETFDAPSEANGNISPEACALGEAVAEWLDSDLVALDEAGLRKVLGTTQHAVNRLTGFRAKVAGVLEQRALSAAPPGGAHQAIRGVRNRTANDLRIAPGEAKRAGETGRRMAELPRAEQAMTAGRLPAEHARILGDTLRWLDPDTRAKAEPALLKAALTENAITFGRTCRRLLAELDSDAANAEQDRRNARRHLRVTQTADGMVALHGQGSGISGEFVLTALHAFRKIDQNGNAEQAMWDALETICRTALDAGTAPRNRNVRPHVLITVPEPVVADRDDTGRGVAETAWSGPLPYQEVRRILSDADVSRVLVDAAGLPFEASAAVRTVPAGLWKALQIRDRVCIADGCDVPAAWCQVMHLDVPYRLHGRLSLDNAAPGCSMHHRMLDQQGWQITWQRGRPILHHPDRAPPPAESADPGDQRASDNSPYDGDRRCGDLPDGVRGRNVEDSRPDEPD